jgi:hypothetical protein
MLSGKAAGARVLAVCTSTPRNTILASGAAPSYIVTDLSKFVVRFSTIISEVEYLARRVSARWIDNKVEVTIDDSEV